VKAGAADLIGWTFAAIADKVLSGAASPGGLFHRSLAWQRGGGSGKGVADMYILKCKMLKYALGPLADKLELPGDMRDQNATLLLQSHSRYRECLHPRGETAKPPTSRGELAGPAACVMFLNFVEALVYGEDCRPRPPGCR
jgi:hypothetical protein